ncbi:hypothetical protein J2X31_001578 [Flavobacterium arsenatis]|uniref:Lipoprotein n=1 Tax=Flavobacterium arsenatis TaxID=1484332 RepID=A0ABU1TQC5_9FLAO|nr:hypothetical protein [Flavobacterium arsenatis]MDR6967567.1 hypothetical protein [Flavobacterium arsenatis]
MKKIYFLFALAFFAIVSSCGPSKSKMTVANKQIPSDFSSYEGTLLIISQYKAWDKYAKSAFESNYKGKFLLIKKNELKNYTDTNEFRYILSPNFGTALNTAPGSRTGSTHVSSERLVLADRKTDKEYKTATTAMYAKLLKRYAEALEIERSK